MKKQRKHYTPEEKVAILRRHLLEKEPISKLCDEMGLQPTVFYRWQKEFFENGVAAFEPKRPSNHSAEQERIAYLEKKIQTKDEVLAELMAEHVALKKEIGGTLTGVWVPHDTRDQVVDFVRRCSEKTEIGAGRFIAGSISLPARSTTGGNATARSMSTTAGFPAISGWKIGRSKPSSASI
jgi:transposase